MQSCGCPWSVCEVVLVPCVVGAVTVMRVLLFVWDAERVRGCWPCWCAGRGVLIEVSTWCEYMGGTWFRCCVKWR